VPAKGALGLWALPSDVERAVLDQVGCAHPSLRRDSAGRCMACAHDATEHAEVRAS
jgi:hypothetical protein